MLSLYVEGESLKGVVPQVQILKERLDSVRLENAADSEEAVAELSRRHDRDKTLLMEENKKLVLELEAVI